MKKYVRTAKNYIIDVDKFKEIITINGKIKCCKLIYDKDLDQTKLVYQHQSFDDMWYASATIICYDSGSIVDSSDNILDLVRKGDLVFTKKGTPLLVTDITSETFTQYDTFIEKKNVRSIRVLQDKDYVLVAEKKNNKWNVKY